MTDWPVSLRGVTESLVATYGPNERWNLAALGLHAGDPVTSKTWGNTRTRRNFHREGGGYVQFTQDPVVFVDAALTIREQDTPVLESADAWVKIETKRIDAGESNGTRWEEWAHSPIENGVEREVVPTVNRGYNAVIEATVAASRLDVPNYDTDELLDRLAYLVDVTRTCGGVREQTAVDRLVDIVDRPELREEM